MAHWAKLDGGHIARFGELTKREIQVISFLFLCRNGDNNHCNPKRKTIAAGLGLKAPHITLALAGLESKGWILDERDGFHLRDAGDIPPPGKVTKLVTKPDEKPAEKVTKSVTKVTKSVKKSYQIGKARLNDSEQVSNRKGTARAPSIKTRIPDPFELTPDMIAWFRENVPDLRLGPVAAHREFVTYWTDAEGKRALKSNWRRTWEVGMSKLLDWQRRDDAKAGVKPGSRPGDAGKNEYQPTPAELAERDRLASLPDCFVCDNTRWAIKVVDPAAAFSWEREKGFPCDACRRADYN